MVRGAPTPLGNASNPGILPRIPQLRLPLPQTIVALETALGASYQILAVHHPVAAIRPPIPPARRLLQQATAPLPAYLVTGTV